MDALILSHFPYREYAFVLSIHLRAFDFQNGRFGDPFGAPVLKQIFEEGSGRLYFITFSLQGISLRSLNLPSGVRFPKRSFWKSSFQSNIGRGPWNINISSHFLRGNKLAFSYFTLGRSISKTAVLEINFSIDYWKRALEYPYFVTLS